MKLIGWEKFQGYTKRGPAWIKLHTSLIDQPQFLGLPLVARAVLPVLWITAARLSDDGSLPDDLAMLAVLAHCSQDELRKALPPLRQAGFISCDESVATPATTLSPQRERETEREGETEIPAPSAPAALVPVVASWSKQACDDWIDRYGGTAPGGQIGKALKPLVEKHGWPAVRQAWRSYLEQSDGEFASASRFAATYGRWSGAAPPGPARGNVSVVDQNRAVLERFVAKEG